MIIRKHPPTTSFPTRAWSAAQLRNDAASNIDKLRRIIDANHDEQADLFCSQPDNS